MKIDDYETRNSEYWDNPEEFMYKSLEERWRSESRGIQGLMHEESIYSNKNLLLNTVSENIYEWNHYFYIPKFQNATIDTLKGKFAKFYDPVSDWVKSFKVATQSNLIFIGSNGTGKTHAAVAACRYMSLHGILKTNESLFMPTCRFLDSVDAHNVLDGWNKKVDVESNVNELKSAGILLIDDIGAVSTSAQSAISNVVSIIAHRYNYNLPTVVTSNVQSDDLVSMYGSTTVRRIIQDNSFVHYS